MARETSPRIVGDYWLDKRPDSEKWQIYWYDSRARTTRCKSTRTSELGNAVKLIDAFALENAKPVRADPSNVMVAQVLATYWKEHGMNVPSHEQIKASIRHWAAFLAVDEENENRGATRVSEINDRLINRFTGWRGGPHSYEGEGRRFSSNGVTGDTIARNIDDLRSAVNWSRKNGDITSAPYIAGTQGLKGSPRDLVLSIDQLAAIVSYDNVRIRRITLGMMATLARVEAVMAWRFPDQLTGGAIDTNPPGKKQTKKYNPIVPLISQFSDIVSEYEGRWVDVKSVKTARRTMVKKLELPRNFEFNTIRHTLNTLLHTMTVPEIQIEMGMGHRKQTTTRRSYTHFRPEYMRELKSALESIWRDVEKITGQDLRTSCGTVKDCSG